MVTHTFCRICEPACGLIASTENGVLRLEPDKLHPVHQGFACSKGLYFGDVHNDPDRVNSPLSRQNPRSSDAGQFETVSWDSALADIARRLDLIRNQYGPDAIAGYVGNPAAFNSKAFLAATGFFKKLGTRMSFSSLTQDTSNKLAATEAIFGTPNMQPVPDLEHTDFFLCLGANPKVSHMTVASVPDPMKMIRAIVARGGRVLYVNPRRIESASKNTGDMLLIQPDTDIYFLASLIDEIHRLGGFNNTAITDKAVNADGLLAFVRRFPSERTAAVTGIPAATTHQLAQDLIRARSASIYMSTGVNMGRQGTLAYWLVQMLSLVTGNLGRPGGNVYSPGMFPAAGVGIENRNRVLDTPFGKVRRIAGTLPGNLLSEFIEAGEPPIRALIVIAGNPLLSVAGEPRLRAAFNKLDLLVSIDLYRNSTGEMADYVLPATDWLERDDINFLGQGFQLKPYVQYTPAVVPPSAERREEWWILAKLEQALGLPSLLDAKTPDPFAGIDRMLAYSQLSIAQLKQEPRGLAMLPALDPSAIFELGIQTQDGKVDCCPEAFADALQRAETLFLEALAQPRDGLHLITRRNTHMHNSWMHNLKQYKGAKFIDNPLWIHPDDARSRSLCAGEAVRVYNDNGEIHALLALDDTLKPGVVAMTHGWGHGQAPGLQTAHRFPGVNVNVLAASGPDSFDPLSNQAFLTGIPVKLARSAADKAAAGTPPIQIS